MYSKIQLYGNCDIDYIWSKEGSLSPEELSSLRNKGVCNIDWTSDTVALSNFNGNIDGNSINQYSNIMKYIVQRREIGTSLITDIAVAEFLSVKDWACQSTKSYEYYITPVYIEGGKERFGKRVITSAISPIWDSFSIIDLTPTSRKGEYVVDEDNVWVFYLNVEEPTYTTNNNVVYTNTYGRFPKEHRGNLNYLSTQITALIGNVACNGDYSEDDISKIERFREFCNNGRIKLFKDIKGNVVPCSVKANTDKFSVSSIENETTISFDIIQLDDKKNVRAYSKGE